jgi:hypothetical protein
MRRKGGKGLMVHGAYGVMKSELREEKLASTQPPIPTLCGLCDELSLRTLREIYYTAGNALCEH